MANCLLVCFEGQMVAISSEATYEHPTECRITIKARVLVPTRDIPQKSMHGTRADRSHVLQKCFARLSGFAIPHIYF